MTPFYTAHCKKRNGKIKTVYEIIVGSSKVSCNIVDEAIVSITITSPGYW